MKKTTVCLATSICASVVAFGAPYFHTEFDEASLGAITGLTIDTPSTTGTNSGTVTLDTVNQTLDMTANSADLWTGRDGAPIAWVAAPTVAVGVTWFVETQITHTNTGTNNSTFDQAGITFYSGSAGANPGSENTGSFQSLFAGISNWNAWQHRIQGFADNNPNIGVNASTTDDTFEYRVEVTENGTSDLYNFFYREDPADAWTQYGPTDLSQDFDNTAVGLFMKCHNNNTTASTEFDYLTIDISLSGADTDGDGLDDGWEIAKTAAPGNLTDLDGTLTGPGPGPGSGDFDGDGLTDLEEFNLAVTNATYPTLDPTNADSDSDTLSDGAEVNGAPATDPTDADTDDDGLDDDKEFAGQDQGGTLTGFGATDPTVADSDTDGVCDGDELSFFATASDPNTPDDTDGDGIPNATEDFNVNCVVDPGETDPLNADTDGDTLSDGVEDANQNGIVDSGETDPLDTDTDADNWDDDQDTDPLDPDQDSDGVLDGDEIGDETNPDNDTDGDGIGNADELAGNNAGGTSHGFGATDPYLIDTDGDTIDDDREIAGQDQSGTSHGFGPTDPSYADTDTDGFDDSADLVYGGDPNTYEDSLPNAVYGYTATGGDWLTAFGANDIDGDGALGTDGFLFYGAFTGTAGGGEPYSLYVESSPSYLVSHMAGAGFEAVASGFARYGEIDDPYLLDGTDQIAGFAQSRGAPSIAGALSETMTFEISGLIAGQVVRVGMLGGIEWNSDGRYDPTELRLSGPGGYVKGGVGLEPNPGGVNAGWLFFDIDTDGIYTVSSRQRLDTFGSGIGGLTFDSIGGPDDLTLSVANAANGMDLVFTWENSAGKTYDILRSTDPEADGAPFTWAVWQANIAADASGTNTETFTRPGDPTSFFVLIAK